MQYKSQKVKSSTQALRQLLLALPGDAASNVRGLVVSPVSGIRFGERKFPIKRSSKNSSFNWGSVASNLGIGGILSFKSTLRQLLLASPGDVASGGLVVSPVSTNITWLFLAAGCTFSAAAIMYEVKTREENFQLLKHFY